MIRTRLSVMPGNGGGVGGIQSRELWGKKRGTCSTVLGQTISTFETGVLQFAKSS
jgi:hypothetical protein